jgi:hypothetical protein
MAGERKISLVLADVDGTLVTEQKILTERAQTAVKSRRKAGIRFAITSGRPPLGMAMLFEPLELETPIARFNGGLFVERDLPSWRRRRCPRTSRVRPSSLCAGTVSMRRSTAKTTGSSRNGAPRTSRARRGR